MQVVPENSAKFAVLCSKRHHMNWRWCFSVTVVCWLSASIGKASDGSMLQKDLAGFERPPMTWIDHPEFMPSEIGRINYLYRKIESGRVDVVGAVVFVTYASADPQINHIIWLIEWKPSRRRSLQR